VTGLSIAISGNRVLPGEAYLSDTPVLRSHAGTQPDLFLRWNEIPLSIASVDVVVFLHGFSQEGRAMTLGDKVMRSGLDLAGRTRPTLAMIPRGNWLRHYYYDFPALLSGGVDQLIDDGLRYFAQAIAAASSGAPGALAVDRFVLAAHSGGGMPAVDVIAGARRPPDELHVFDGLYGRDPATGNPMQGLEVIDRWLSDRLQQEAEREGALRVIYIEQQTGPFSRPGGGVDHSTSGDCRPGSGCELRASLPGRSLRGPAFPNCAPLRARAAGRSGCAVRLVAIESCYRCWSIQASSKRQPLKRLLTITVIPCTRG
jgi:hypothetical protein